MFVFSIPQHQQAWNESYTSSKPIIYRYHMKFPEEYHFFYPTESVHGLISFENSETPIVWNPSVRQLLTLPKPEETWKHITCLLGYDPIEDKHKVVCMPFGKTFDECWVLTLEPTQKSWRRIKTDHKHRSFFFTHGQCINGIIYYQAHIDDSSVLAIMSFDVRSEKFHMIKLPSDIFLCTLIPYQGKLRCFFKNTMNNGMTLLILEDAEKHEWSCKHFLAPLLYYDQSLETHFRLDGITHAGEFIYVEYGFYKSFYILFYDPEKNSFRKVEFMGIADDEVRLSNGIGDGRIYALYTLHDHIESLKSL